MKKIKSIIQILVVVILFLSSCKSESCEQNKLGDLTFSSRADNFSVYQDSQIVTFVNQVEEAIVGSNNKSDSYHKVRLDLIGESQTPLTGIKSFCYDYYESIKKTNRFRFEESDFSIIVTVQHESDNKIDIKERVSFVLRHRNDSNKTVSGYYDYETGEFANPVYEENAISVKSEIDELDLNGKIFTNVLAAENENSAIYFKENIGVIGFLVDGEIWVLE